MKFVYDLRKPEVMKGLFNLYLRTSYRLLYWYGFLCVFLGIVIFVLGLQFDGAVQIFLSIIFAVLIVFALLIMLFPPFIFKMTIKRLAKRAIPILVDFKEGEIDFIHKEKEQVLFSIPYELILDIKVNKEWIILLMKPNFKNMMEIQEKYAIPMLELYKLPLTKSKLMTQDLEEMIRLFKKAEV